MEKTSRKEVKAIGKYSTGKISTRSNTFIFRTACGPPYSGLENQPGKFPGKILPWKLGSRKPTREFSRENSTLETRARVPLLEGTDERPAKEGALRTQTP